MSHLAETLFAEDILFDTFAVTLIHDGHLQNIFVVGLITAISSCLVQDEETIIKNKAAIKLQSPKEILNFFIATDLQSPWFSKAKIVLYHWRDL